MFGESFLKSPFEIHGHNEGAKLLGHPGYSLYSLKGGWSGKG